MQCANCGAPVVLGQRFCSKCGRPVAMPPPPVAVPAPPPQPVPAAQPSFPGPGAGYAGPSRVARHVTTLGLLWIIYSGLRLIPGMALLVLGHTSFPFMTIPTPMHLFLGPFLRGLGLAVSGIAIAGLIAGAGLLARRPWARVLAIVLGCISLIHFPLGTALGIYTVWVLAPQGRPARLFQPD